MHGRNNPLPPVLLELSTGCRNLARATPGGGRRFRLAGRIIKGKKLGGVPDEWVVIEEVDRAVALAERITGGPKGAPVFSNVGITPRLERLRSWLKSCTLGPSRDPQGPVFRADAAP